MSAEEAGRRLRAIPAPKLLLIRQHHQMGDFLLSTPVFQALRNAFPRAILHFLGSPHNTAAATGNPDLDRVTVFRKRAMWNPFHAIRFLSALRAERYEAAMVLTSNCVTFEGAMLARLSGAALVIGYDTGFFGERWSRTLYHVEVPFAGLGQPEVELNLDLVRAIGVDAVQPVRLSYRPPDWALRECEERITLRSGRSAEPRRPLIGLFTGGGSHRPGRLWPTRQIADTANAIGSRARIVLLGGPGAEAQRLRETLRLCTVPVEQFQDDRLEMMTAALSRLDAAVIPDGGLLHLAAAVGCPVVGLFFETDPAIWMPPAGHGVALRAPDISPALIASSLITLAA